jgi:GT2 family glycosyltransferase
VESEGPTEAAPPPVVAVVVTHNPGEWLDEVMESLAAQDYLNLSVLVIDADSDDDPTPRVARVMPGAFVRRLDANNGFGAAANEVLDVVDGAAFYLFCHDDVALAPDATRQLAEEAFRSNAGVVGPKLVRWDDPKRLLQVGETVDKLGSIMPLVDRDELDQEQHDAVRDVFAVPGACTLVRADLFVEIGGFDEAINFLLDDVSLCWRAHVAGARVVVAPAARVRHLEALGNRRPEDDRRRLQSRHRLRIVLTCYSRFSLLRVLPQAAVLAFVESLYALIVGRTAHARDVAGAWMWNLRRLSDIRAARAHVRSFRHVRDVEVRRFQTGGFARLSLFVRGQIGRGGEDRLAGLARSGRELAGSLQTGTARLTISAWLGIVALFVIGSRHLLLDGVPAVGTFVPFRGSSFALLREWVSGWRSAGLGSESPAPTGLGVFGMLGVLSGGALGLVRTVLIVGLLPAGAISMHRLAAPIGSRRARTVAVVAYVANPIPYNAIATGSWGALAMWAAAPLVIARVGRAATLAPFAGPSHRTRHHVLALGVVTALVAVVLPAAPLLVVAIAVVLVVGSLLGGARGGSARVLTTAAGGALVAMVLHLPWTFDFLAPGSTWSSLVGVDGGGAARTLPELLRFQTGPLGASPAGWAFLGAAALPLLIGREWRFEWAVRGWSLAIAFVGLAWAAERGSLPFDMPSTGVLLVPAAAGLALSAALGMVAFELDLPGYRFGLRQVAAGLSFVALVIAVVPTVGAAANGRWSAPGGDYRHVLERFAADARTAPFRMLWIGDPELLPLASWHLDDAVGYGTSIDGTPGADALWSGSDDGATRLLADAVGVAIRGETIRLGQLLAPMGVRYIVLTSQLAPDPYSTEERPPPDRLLNALAQQVDLTEVDLNTALVVYRNLSYVPTRAEVAPGTGDGPVGLGAPLSTEFNDARPVLTDPDGYARWKGPINSNTRVLLSAASSARWQLHVNGARSPRHKSFGWANAFDVGDGGPGTMRFKTPLSRYGMLLIQAGLWLVAVRTLLRMRLGERAT